LRTTLKRGLGRVDGNGNGRVVLPPGPVTPVTRYRQPPPPRRGVWATIRVLLGWGFAAILMVIGGLAGGYYLFLHREVAKLQAHTPGFKLAARKLDIVLPGQPTTALVIGYDHRLGADAGPGQTSRSDTVMLLRADPATDSLSLLSFPRDLVVNRICPGHVTVQDRINAAFAVCGPRGTLETVKQLTGLPINYLITVNFHGFKDIVSRVGGVWLDIDRRYYNKNVGTAETDYAGIDLHPGYQELNGAQALDYVRYRHTDSDIYRTARQQLFLTALKQQVRRTFSAFNIPGLIDAIVSNVEVAEGGSKSISLNTIKSYALFAYGLPSGHIFRTQIQGLQPYGPSGAELITDPSNIQKAVEDFVTPDVQAPTQATAAALGVKPKPTTAPPASDTTVLVLNGNGVGGSASRLGGLLHDRQYSVVVPPNGLPANAPTFDYFHSKVYYPAGHPRYKAAARSIANLIGEADVVRLPRSISNYGAMVTVIVGSTFHGSVAPAPVDQTPQHVPPAVAPASSQVFELAKEAQRHLSFRVEVPHLIESTSQPDYEEPARVYSIGNSRALRLVFRTGQSEYWGVQETNWNNPPILTGPNLARRLGGRWFKLYYSGSHLHMVALQQNGATYWVENTLLDSLSNETMLAIAKSLRTYGH
jgi:LCP family protein required for cell wall assembly